MPYHTPLLARHGSKCAICALPILKDEPIARRYVSRDKLHPDYFHLDSCRNSSYRYVHAACV